MDFNVKKIQKYEFNGHEYDTINEVAQEMADTAIYAFNSGKLENVLADLDTLIDNLQRVREACKTL